MNEHDQINIEVLEHWLAGAKYYLKKNRITAAYWQIYYCCEVLDEMIEENTLEADGKC